MADRYTYKQARDAYKSINQQRQKRIGAYDVTQVPEALLDALQRGGEARENSAPRGIEALLSGANPLENILGLSGADATVARRRAEELAKSAQAARSVQSGLPVEDPTMVPKSDASGAFSTGNSLPPDRPMPGGAGGVANPTTSQDPFVYPMGHAFEGQPYGEYGKALDYPAFPGRRPVAARALDSVLDISRAPYELQINEPPKGYGKDIVDATTKKIEELGPQPPPEIGYPYPDPGPRTGPVPEDWLTGPPIQEPAATEAPAEAPPAEEEPAGPPPMISLSDLTGPATGALSLEEWDSFMKERYPDLDFSNPAQAKADANAQRDLDRTAMLAQLTLAGGIVAGAGKSWEGIGKGFMGAADTYDKGFEKYQNALQKSADRYGEQQKTKQAYDLARGAAALDTYTSLAKEDRADRRELVKWANDKSFERWKFTEEGKRGERKLSSEEIRAAYNPHFKALEPDPTNIDVDAEAAKAQKRSQLTRELEASLRLGVMLPPGSLHDLVNR